VQVLLIADTHVPRRARTLPDEVWRLVDTVDVVVHAGDWVDASLVDEVQARAGWLVGVHGNNDGAEIRARLPEVARVDLDGLRLGVVHETGQATGRERRCDTAHPGLDVLVFGHSHIPWDTVTPSGMRLLNPGSPTDRRRQPHHTYLTASVREGSLTDLTLHQL